MTVREYEERFRPPAPSLYQTFAAVRGRDRRRLRQRIRTAAARLLTITRLIVWHRSLCDSVGRHHPATTARGSKISDHKCRRIQALSLIKAVECGQASGR
jgi:hypothetical protein